MKMHITADGPDRCRKDPKKNSVCPFAPEDSHFDTKVEAMAEWNKRQSANQQMVNTLQAKSEKLTKREAEMREKHAELAKKIVEMRADSISGIAYEDANPDRAKRRLKEAIDFAKDRQNEHLVEKLSNSMVLPSGAFKLDDGSRANVDKLLRAKTVMNHVEAQREAALQALSKMAQEESDDSTKDKFSVKTAAGSFSMTVKEGYDEDAFHTLPKATQAKMMTDKSSLNMDLAREHLTPAQIEELSYSTQVMDFVMGKPQDVGQDTMVIKEAQGANANEKLEDGLKNIASFYETVAKDHGKVRELKDEIKTSTDAIKKVAAKTTNNTFVPARSQYNGTIVSGRRNLDPKKVAATLDAKTIAKISVIAPAVDEAKAASVLSTEEYNRIFKAKKVAIRVTEAK